MKKLLSALFAFVMLFSCTVFTLPALAVTSYDVTADYTGNVKIGSASCAANNGIVDHYPYATTEKVTVDGISALKVTPDPTYAQSKTIALDQYSYGALGIDLTSLKYVQLYVKYTGTTQLGKAKLNFMPQYKKELVRTCPCESIETMTTGWQWLTFNAADALYGSVNSGGVLSQFHYYVYGDIPVQQLKATDVMYVAKIRFVSQSSAAASGISRRYPVYFSKGRADVEGTELDPVYVTPGSSVTLPQCPYTRENYTFRGWVNGADLELYQPGDRVTINERNLNPSLTTARTYFIADWAYTAPESLDPDMLTVDFSSNYNALLGNKDYATVTKNFKFKGRNTLKVAIINTKNYPLNLDSWELTKIPFDIDKYKYATVTYYYQSNDPISVTPSIRLLPNGGAISGQYIINSKSPLQANKWSVMCFDLTGADAKKVAGVSPHIIKQIHWQLSGDIKNVTEFADGDVIYLDKITLYQKKPYRVPTVQTAYFEGLEDGNFHPGSPLKRSEAAELLVKVMEKRISFSSVTPCTQTDVPSSASYKRAVDALEYYHVIPGNTAFRPGDSITRREFTEWIVRTLIVLGGKSVVPTELAFSADNSVVTRAQAAYFVNRLLLGDEDTSYSSDVIPFPDVTKGCWFYPDVVKLCSERLSYTDASGSEVWVFPFYGETNFDITAGDAYVTYLDGKEEQRIEEIRSTDSTCAPLKDGRTFYVTSDSAYGRTNNDGLSESTARLITSLSGVSGLGARKGDVVLFRRGDIFRGTFTTTAGVTYSAYGEGDKPKFYRSERNYTGSSNWTLDYSNSSTGAKIWKYNSTVTNDVGCIVCNDGEVIGLKEIPDYTGSKYYVRGSGAATEFDYKVQLDKNHEFFHNISGGSVSGSGYVYFRCDEGNPGQLFADIEFNQRGNCIGVGTNNNVTIDNICIKYFGSHGIGASSVTNLTVTNCEIGWGGGSIQHYTNGSVTRFGNGVEIYGGLVNYTIDNCRVYQIYDAGITHQISSSSSGNYYMENVRYTNNVLTDCTYNIEYFMSKPTSGTYERLMKNVLFENNLIRRAGYGWGVQRPDQAPAGIKGWTHNNTAINFTVRNNIIDRCYNISGNTAPIMQLGATYEGCTAYLEGNTFVQVPGRAFAYIGQTTYTHDENLSYTLAKLGGKDNVYYFASN